MAPGGAVVDQLKQEGNDKFKSGEYAVAVVKYSECIEHDPKNHIHYSNRSAARVKLAEAPGPNSKDFLREALEDAQRCVEIAPNWPKGYNRLATAHLTLGEVDEARSAAEKGREIAKAKGSADLADPLTKLLEVDIPNREFQEKLKGTWHGTVHKDLGGYDQEMEFIDERQVRIEVLGRSITGSYWISAKENPIHMTIQVPMTDIPPGMPPPPPVPYIAKIDGDGLHLCCPYLKMERPVDFSGPGQCLMAKGALGADDDSDIKELEPLDKLKACATAMMKALPDTKLEDPSRSDSEEVMGQKMMAQVQYESNRFAVQKKFGEDTWQKVADAARGDTNAAPAELNSSQELQDLISKLRKVGFMDETESKAPTTDAQYQPAPVYAAAPAAEPTKTAPTRSDSSEIGGPSGPQRPKKMSKKMKKGADPSVVACAGASALAALVAAAFILRKQK